MEVGASDCAIGTPDGVQLARAIRMVLEIDAWDIELLLAVKGTSLGSSASRPCSTNSSPGSRSAARARLASTCGLRGPDRDEYGVTIGCEGAWPSQWEQLLRGIQHEYRARIYQKMQEDIAGEGAIRLEEAVQAKTCKA